MVDDPGSSRPSIGHGEPLPERLRVVLRLRPVPEIVHSEGDHTFGCAGTLDWAERRVDLPEGVSCSFDEVFGEEESPDQVFRSALQPLVDGVVAGYNGTLFTWGAPSTGKTKTVFGEPPADPTATGGPEDAGGGLARLAAERLFDLLGQLQRESPGLCVRIRPSALELGGLEVVDLLTQCDDQYTLCDERPVLRRPFLFNGGATVVEASAQNAHISVDSLLQTLSVARHRYEQRRRSLPEGLNRRHFIFSIEVELEADPHNVASPFSSLSARLSLVDLAGSVEGGEQTRAASASALADVARVVEALVERSSNMVIPYGASPLTQLMRDALGGNCRTVMLLTAAGSAEALKAEIFVPISALQLASRASEVVNFPVPNILPSEGTSTVQPTTARLAVPRLELERVSSGTATPSPTNGNRLEAKSRQNSLLQMAVDDSVFDMSMDSEVAVAELSVHHYSSPDAALPAGRGTSSCTSPTCSTPLSGGSALSPISKRVEAQLPPAALPTRLSTPASWPAVTSAPVVKRPPMPRPDSAVGDVSMVREALQRKLAEMGANGVSVLGSGAFLAVKSPTNRSRLNTREALSPAASDATLPPGHIRYDAIMSVVDAAATPASPPEAPQITFGIDKAAATSSRPDPSTHAAVSSRQSEQGSERLASTEALLEKRTLQLMKTQLGLQEATQRERDREVLAERLRQKCTEKDGIISALEHLLGLLLSRQGPELFEDIASLDSTSLAALRSFAISPMDLSPPASLWSGPSPQSSAAAPATKATPHESSSRQASPHDSSQLSPQSPQRSIEQPCTALVTAPETLITTGDQPMRLPSFQSSAPQQSGDGSPGSLLAAAAASSLRRSLRRTSSPRLAQVLTGGQSKSYPGSLPSNMLLLSPGSLTPQTDTASAGTSAMWDPCELRDSCSGGSLQGSSSYVAALSPTSTHTSKMSRSVSASGLLPGFGTPDHPQLASVVLQGTGGTFCGSPANAVHRSSSPAYTSAHHRAPMTFPGLVAGAGVAFPPVSSVPHYRSLRCTPRSVSPPSIAEHRTVSIGATLLATMAGSIGAPVAPLLPTSMTPQRPTGSTQDQAIAPPPLFVLPPAMASFVGAAPVDIVDVGSSTRSASSTDLAARYGAQRTFSATRLSDVPAQASMPRSSLKERHLARTGQLAPPTAAVSGRAVRVHHDMNGRSGSPIVASRMWVTPPPLGSWVPPGAPPHLGNVANTPPASMGVSASSGFIRPPGSQLPVSTPPIKACRDRPAPEYRPSSVRPRSRPPAKASNKAPLYV